MLHHYYKKVYKKTAFTLAEVFLPYPTCQRRNAFTLAEVLITLGIIGVVAAMTLPSLIADHREKQTVAQLKKMYNTLSNAYLSVLNEYGEPDGWGLPDRNNPLSSQMFMEKFDKYFQYTKKCGNTEDGCYPKEVYAMSGGITNSDTLTGNLVVRSVLSDGSAIVLKSWNNACKDANDICAFFEIDLNGLKKPNQFGRDLFRFYVTPKTIIPYGSPIWSGEQNFASNCLNGAGSACTAWVLINENLDYLHCPDKLGWDKAKSCKE